MLYALSVSFILWLFAMILLIYSRLSFIVFFYLDFSFKFAWSDDDSLRPQFTREYSVYIFAVDANSHSLNRALFLWPPWLALETRNDMDVMWFYMWFYVLNTVVSGDIINVKYDFLHILLISRNKSYTRRIVAYGTWRMLTIKCGQRKEMRKTRSGSILDGQVSLMGLHACNS